MNRNWILLLSLALTASAAHADGRDPSITKFELDQSFESNEGFFKQPGMTGWVSRYKLEGDFSIDPSGAVTCGTDNDDTPTYVYYSQSAVIDIAQAKNDQQCRISVYEMNGGRRKTTAKRFTLTGSESAPAALISVSSTEVLMDASISAPSQSSYSSYSGYSYTGRSLESRLSAKNIRVTVNGTAVPENEIHGFTHDAQPMTVGILIDFSGSMNPEAAGYGNSKLKRAQEAAMSVVRALDKYRDNAFVVHFNSKVVVNDDPETEDSTRPETARIDQTFAMPPDWRLPLWVFRRSALDPNCVGPCGIDPNNIDTTTSPLHHWAFDGTAMFKAVEQAIGLLTAKHPANDPNGARSKKVLVIITDGADRSNGMDSAIRKAVASSVIVNTIGLFDEKDSERDLGTKIMNTFTNKTGGTAYYPGSNGSLDSIASAIVSDLHTQYHFGVAVDSSLNKDCNTISMSVSDGNLILGDYNDQLAGDEEAYVQKYVWDYKEKKILYGDVTKLGLIDYLVKHVYNFKQAAASYLRQKNAPPPSTPSSQSQSSNQGQSSSPSSSPSSSNDGWRRFGDQPAPVQPTQTDSQHRDSNGGYDTLSNRIARGDQNRPKIVGLTPAYDYDSIEGLTEADARKVMAQPYFSYNRDTLQQYDDAKKRSLTVDQMLDKYVSGVRDARMEWTRKHDREKTWDQFLSLNYSKTLLQVRARTNFGDKCSQF